jgi:EAL domain-containing protein (putative c-di-GMP-specific phosphodiesterase class I)
MLPDLVAAAAAWASPDVPVWIALSDADLVQTRLPDQISAALLSAGLSPESLVVEVRPADASVSVPAALSGLRTRGIRAAVDMSVAGPLTLLALPDLPVDWIRLAPDLTRGVLADPRAALVLEHTLALAGGLGIVVVAEATDESTTAWLTRRGCRVLASESAVLSSTQLVEWRRTADEAAAD